MKVNVLFLAKLLGYVGVGGISALVDASCFYMANSYFGIFYLWALVIGFIPGVIFNFLLCNHLLFYKYKRNVFGAWYRHLLASLFSFFINASLLFLFIEVFFIKNYLLARIIAISFGFIISFSLIRYFAFQDHKYFKYNQLVISKER